MEEAGYFENKGKSKLNSLFKDWIKYMSIRLFLASISFFFVHTPLKTYSTGYFRKQQNETGYFFGMTLSCSMKSDQIEDEELSKIF